MPIQIVCVKRHHVGEEDYFTPFAFCDYCRSPIREESGGGYYWDPPPRDAYADRVRIVFACAQCSSSNELLHHLSGDMRRLAEHLGHGFGLQARDKTEGASGLLMRCVRRYDRGKEDYWAPAFFCRACLEPITGRGNFYYGPREKLWGAKLRTLGDTEREKFKAAFYASRWDVFFGHKQCDHVFREYAWGDISEFILFLGGDKKKVMIDSQSRPWDQRSRTMKQQSVDPWNEDAAHARLVIDKIAFGKWSRADVEWLEQHKGILTIDQEATLAVLLRADREVEKAVIAERKRCARVAEQMQIEGWFKRDKDGVYSQARLKDSTSDHNGACKAIAAEILKPGSTLFNYERGPDRLPDELVKQQAARDAAYAAELEAQQQAERKNKARAAAELNVALDTLLEKVPHGGSASSNGTKPTCDTDDAGTVDGASPGA